jgi:DNA-binding transcriptional ArsR family regulator
MDVMSGDLSALVFKRVPTQNLGEFSLDGRMLGILMEVDGRQSMGAIARKLGLSPGAIRPVVSKLLELGLIEADENALSILDAQFLKYLKEELALAVGPIAEVLIEDAAGDLGYTPERFPAHRAAELVDLLARQIRREEKMTLFKQNMVDMIREKEY